MGTLLGMMIGIVFGILIGTIPDGETVQLKIENVALKRAAKAWLDGAVYDEDSHTWTVFEKNDEYHTLYALLADTQESE